MWKEKTMRKKPKEEWMNGDEKVVGAAAKIGGVDGPAELKPIDETIGSCNYVCWNEMKMWIMTATLF